jgi:acetoin utilization deacetylase AcuC-like enzyme
MDDLHLFYPAGHEAHYERGHPERPGRIEAIRQAFEKAGLWDEFTHVDPKPVPIEVLHTAHDPIYLQKLQDASKLGTRLDMDTYITPESWQLALNAICGTFAVVQAVWRREATRGFSLSRPPGHHATRDRAMGFCLLNNIAVAAECLIQVEDAERLAIVDIDLHHGNGTQDIFYDRSEVFFFSTHQSPLYPGTGSLRETGVGPGENLTANLPLPPHSGDKALRTCMNAVIIPLLERFEPQMILISAGFDAHWLDPLGQLLVSTNCYGDIISQLSNWADKNCEGRIALILEGGYALEAVANSALAASQALLGTSWDDTLGLSPTPEQLGWKNIIAQAKELWSL